MKQWQIRLRSFARRTGVVGLINMVRPKRNYEEAVSKALETAIEEGDVVWDIGANVGVYSEMFCQWVGQDGTVVAFEPFPGSCDQIRERVPNCPWLIVENVALGDTDMPGLLVIGSESVENHLATGLDTELLSGVPVAVCRGDTVCKRLGRNPNVLKVDVEGFEEEVLSGMPELLASPTLRTVLVEVHFKKLEMRGRANAPIRIENLLSGKGFKIRWVDASHLFAAR